MASHGTRKNISQKLDKIVFQCASKENVECVFRDFITKSIEEGGWVRVLLGWDDIVIVGLEDEDEDFGNKI